MGSLTRNENSKNKNENKSIIPEYAKDYKREWQYIRGINKTCGIFLKKLEKIDFRGYEGALKAEDIFFSGMAKSIIKDINNVLKAQERGQFKKIKDLSFRQEDYEEINELVFELYELVHHLCIVEPFRDFFDNFITFYFICIKFIKINILSNGDGNGDGNGDSDGDSDSDSDSDSDIEINDNNDNNLIIFSDSDSDSDS